MSKRFGRAAHRPLVAGQQQGRGDFTPDYTHVRRDLRRIGILAGFFVLLLVALSFIL
jgi:hypothetical protein